MSGYAKVVMRWYRFEETNMPIGRFSLESVRIIPLEGHDGETSIWPPRSRAAPKYPPKPGGGDDVPAGDDDDDRGHADDPDIDQGCLGEEASDDEMGADLADLLEELAGASEEGPSASDAGADRADAHVVVDGRLVDEPAPSERPDDAGNPAAIDHPHMREGARRSGATATLQCWGGSISYYPSKGAFEAVCDRAGHGKCVLTRTARSKRNSSGAAVSGGRPVGFLAAWLNHGPNCATKAEHWAHASLDRPFAERSQLRREIEACGETGRTLLGCERPAGEGESAEPLSLHGYLAGAAR